MGRALKRIDLLRHELKALRYLLDNFHTANLRLNDLPSREDFQNESTRLIYDAIINSSSRDEAERRIAALELEDVDLESFLRLSGQHYYTYPELVRQRAQAIRRGEIEVEEG